MFDELNAVLKNICKEVGPNLYQAKDGLIKLSMGSRVGVIVEFAENGVEAEKGLFDDVGFYPDTDECLKEALLDLYLAEEYEDAEAFIDYSIEATRVKARWISEVDAYFFNNADDKKPVNRLDGGIDPKLKEINDRYEENFKELKAKYNLRKKI